MLGLILRAGWAYRRTMWYLLRKRGPRAVLNFLYVKLFVPTGEGAGAGAYYIIGPFIRRFPWLAPYPRYVEIEVTTRCNKRCILCEHTYWREPSLDLTFQQFKKIVDDFPRLRWVNLTGEGDAFLNKDYLRMIEYLKRKDVIVYLVDSFDLIDVQRAERLVRLGVDGIYVSMDGATPETYEKIKVGCSFDRTLKNLRTLIAFKKELASPIPELCFRYIITNLNFQEMPQFVSLVRSLGDRKLMGDGSKIHYAGLLAYEEIKDYCLPRVPVEIYREAARESRRDKENLPVVFAHTEPDRLPSINRCLAWMEPYIMMGGYVLPCCAVLMSNQRDFLREHALGNVLERPFKEIWSSPRYTRFREAVNNPHAKVPLLCRGCRAYNTWEREEKCGVDMEL